MPIKLKRVYEAASPVDGDRYLVERLWPRGIGKRALALSGWLKELAPSTDLRKWYSHDPERWSDFASKYVAELAVPEKQAILAEVSMKAKVGDVTLVFATRDAEHSGAAVLKSVLDELL